MRKPKLPRPNHRLHPLRRIEGYDTQNGVRVTKLVCKHSAVGWPEDKRTARYYPCPACYEKNLEHRAVYAKTGSLARTVRKRGK